MTTPPIPGLPMAMIVAARDVLLVHRGDVWASSITGVVHSWSCSCGEAGPVDNRREGDRLAANHIAAVTLAAALGVCEVREDWGARYVDLHAEDGLPVDVTRWMPERHNNRREAVAFADDLPWGFHAQVITRLLISTPAEQVDTEGAPA